MAQRRPANSCRAATNEQEDGFDEYQPVLGAAWSPVAVPMGRGELGEGCMAQRRPANSCRAATNEQEDEFDEYQPALGAAWSPVAVPMGRGELGEA
jgi:hypothetical protein